MDAATEIINTNGKNCPYQKKQFYAAIMSIAASQRVEGDSADTMRRRALQSKEGQVLWAAHNLAPDLPQRSAPT
jgi:hypothetical protein